MKNSKLCIASHFTGVLLLTILSASGSVYAAERIGAGIYAFPAAGQSDDQADKDSLACHNWSVRQTDFDPTRDYAPPQTYASSPPPGSSGYFGSGETGQGGVMRDAAGGAALGAMGGAIAGNAGRGAAIGAASSVLFGGIKRNQRKAEEEAWRQQQQQQQAQQQAAFQREINLRTDDYRRAYSACMTSRKYTVQ